MNNKYLEKVHNRTTNWIVKHAQLSFGHAFKFQTYAFWISAAFCCSAFLHLCLLDMVFACFLPAGSGSRERERERDWGHQISESPAARLNMETLQMSKDTIYRNGQKSSF